MLFLVSAQTVHIAIDASVDGEQIRGHIGHGISGPRAFTGWLELIGALDGLLSVPNASGEEPQVRVCIPFATAEQAEAFAGSPELDAAMRKAVVGGGPEIVITAES
jgi:hypothetical protein